MFALILAVAASGCFVLAVLGYRQTKKSLVEELDWLSVQDPSEEHRKPALARVLDLLGGVFERFVVRRYGARRLQTLDDRLVLAGRPEGFTARAFLRRKAGFIVVGVLLFVLFWSTGQQFVALLLVGMCWSWMDIWIRLAGRNRQDRIDRDIPDFLDVLAVTVSAGLAFRSALDRVSQRSSGPVAEEMLTTLREMDIGIPRRRAFAHLRDRNHSKPLGSFVTAVLQSEELGVPLSQSLTDIAAEIRREFAQETRQRAAKAGPKVSLVVTVTIVPGAMLLIASAMVLANLDRFRGVF